jgi:hypothetical protein
MPVTREQAYTIGHVAHAVREWLRADRADLPEWHVEGIVKNIERIANRRFPDVALAAIRAAMDPGAKTPGVIPTDGPHWAEGVTYDPPRIPKLHEECPLHAGNWRDACHGCAADKAAGTVWGAGRPATAETRDAAIAKARADLDQRTADRKAAS